ncbi:YbhN family protein [Nocardia sp. NBC_00565]|uniref:lysylphosphatidylglycerol synthase transmembrane domain-containing protein n=1 Tax=Nocardia sp. NBC_00565 TaxID=2975993 RepID=UPI002E812C3B|nr:YbhN family protein [Nocardia sp. NBC_00565]WUC02321.1 YbhN family protein [Nocardia sp. NBC_00565]
MTGNGELAGEPGPPPPDEPSDRHSQRGRFWWVKWVGGIALLALLIGEGYYLWPRLHDSWNKLTEIHWGWVAACIWMQAISMSGFSRVQKQLLHAGGVEVRQRKSVAVVYGATAMSVSLPAGQVFSTAFTYRQTRRWGANPMVASWQLVISGVVATAGLALLGVGGALLVGSRVGPFKLILSLVGVAALVWVGNHISKNPGALEAVLRRGLALLNRLRKRPADQGLSKIADMLSQLESVKLGKRDGAMVAGWAVVHRFADVACLGAACYAVGADPKLAGLLIAFTAGKAVGSIPFAPGGIVYVDATLIYGLTAGAALPASQAVAAAFVYRLVSFILVAIIGWIVFAFLFRTPQADDAEFEKEFEQRRL